MDALELWRPLVALWKSSVKFLEHAFGMCPARLLSSACDEEVEMVLTFPPRFACSDQIRRKPISQSLAQVILSLCRLVGLPPTAPPVLKLEMHAPYGNGPWTVITFQLPFLLGMLDTSSPSALSEICPLSAWPGKGSRKRGGATVQTCKAQCLSHSKFLQL